MGRNSYNFWNAEHPMEAKTQRLISVPNEALPYIAYQRTGYLRLQNNILFKSISRLLGDRRGKNYRRIRLESMLRGRSIRKEFISNMWAEYNEIREYLPERVEKVLDVGRGVAGIDVFLHRHYASATPISFYLLDKSSVDDRIYYDFKQQGAFYNSLEVARSLLVQNGIAEGSIFLIEAAQDNRIDIDGPIDLIISLISWGFHHPVDTYLDRVHDLLRPGGSVILDIRKNTNGAALLRQRFSTVLLISDTPKKERYSATR